ncbi:MAG: RecQ family zinc-binding domain-containing protein [Cyanobacteria bacterium J06598_1]
MIERHSDGSIVEIADDVDLEIAVDQAMTAQQRRKQFERSRLDMIRGYAETESCRREYVLSYFGETLSEGWDGCDRCDQSSIAIPTALSLGQHHYSYQLWQRPSNALRTGESKCAVRDGWLQNVCHRNH